MSLIYMSGFEGAPKNREVPMSGITYTANGRTGMCMNVPGGTNCPIVLPAGTTEIIVGVACKPLPGYDTGYPASINLMSPSGQVEVAVHFAGNSQIVARRNGDFGNLAIVGSASGWTMDTWSYIEMHVKLHATTGHIRVWINGTLEIDFSGNTLDDVLPERASLTTLLLSGTGYSFAGTLQYDDLYILDMTDGTGPQGRPFNAVLGMPKVEPLTLQGSGPVNEWIGSDGDSVDNHLLVDEMPPSATDYVESSTVGQRELYDFSTPTLSGEVLAVDVFAFAASPDGGSNPIKMVARSADGTVQAGPGVVPATTFKNVTDGPKGKDPDGNLWTKTAVGDATYGVEVG